jgi:hypothetical protein
MKISKKTKEKGEFLKKRSGNSQLAPSQSAPEKTTNGSLVK